MDIAIILNNLALHQHGWWLATKAIPGLMQGLLLPSYSSCNLSWKNICSFPISKHVPCMYPLGVHNHHVAIGVCHEWMDIVFQCVANVLPKLMDKFSNLASPKCKNFVASLKRFICSGMGFMDSIMMLKDHYGFKYVHDSWISWKSKENSLYSTCLWTLLEVDSI